MKKKSIILLLSVLLLIIVLAAIIYPRLSASYMTENSQQSSSLESAADFTVYDTDGTSVSLSDQTGKPVIVNFWATWCGYCLDELPAFSDMSKKYGDKIQFMMVDLTDGDQETPEASMEFMETNGYDFPAFFDNDQSAVQAYGISSIPVTLFIDSEGNIFHKQIGAMDKDTLERNILSLIDGTKSQSHTTRVKPGCSFH